MQQRVRWACVLVLILNVPYCVLLLPVVRPDGGFDPVVDQWLNGLADAAIIVAILLVAGLNRATRAGWLSIAAAMVAALLASLLWYSYYRSRPTTTGLTWSDLGWLAFYVLLFLGMVLLLRTRIRRMWAGLWFDGLVAGLTAAAVAVAYVPGADPAQALERTGFAGLYPVGDLMLFGLGAAALAMLGRARDLTWWLLCAAFVVFAVSDWVYAEQLARGDYVVGGPLELGWQIPRLALLGAALASLRTRGGGPTTPDGLRVLAVPGACALAALGLLFHAATASVPVTATVLALAAGVAAVGRTALTVGEVRMLADAMRQARTDDLTGLANRRHFYDALRRGGDDALHRPCAVVLVDLDRFKEVNDSLGHQAGDQLLRQVSERLTATVGGLGLLARLGGDEYALLMDGAGEDDARRTASRIQADLAAPFRIGAASVVIGGSIGIALAPQHARDSQELLQMADLAMYAAKASRRGTEVYDEDRDGSGRYRLERITELREAIGSQQLVLHYQPQLDLRSGRVTGVEALVRWQHPVHGLLGPQHFVDLAESAGLMGRLTSWVLDEALAQCGRWRRDGLDLRVAVNVSPSVVVDQAFPGDVEALLAHHAVPGRALALEVTEELLMDNRERTVNALVLLRRLGVRVSIDDYGTGYSSLAYLKDLPVTELKLDRSFVASMNASPRSAAIVHSTVNLAHALGLDLVAEGVEDVATLDALVAAGCDLVQGYLLSRPVASSAVADVVTGLGSGAHRAR